MGLPWEGRDQEFGVGMRHRCNAIGDAGKKQGSQSPIPLCHHLPCPGDAIPPSQTWSPHYFVLTSNKIYYSEETSRYQFNEDEEEVEQKEVCVGQDAATGRGNLGTLGVSMRKGRRSMTTACGNTHTEVCLLSV